MISMLHIIHSPLRSISPLNSYSILIAFEDSPDKIRRIWGGVSYVGVSHNANRKEGTKERRNEGTKEGTKKLRNEGRKEERKSFLSCPFVRNY